MTNYRCYDHRIKQMIADTGNPNLFPQLKIPQSTSREWIKKKTFDVVTLPELNYSNDELATQVSQLKDEIETLKTKQKLVIFTFRIFGFRLQYQRLPKAENKQLLLEAIQAAAKQLSLKACLNAIGLSLARYRNWLKSNASCELENVAQCPRHHPTALSNTEIGKIIEYVTSKRFAHFSIASLALYTKRQGDVFASHITWSRVVRKLKLRRPLKRIYPAKPKIGIRASAPNKLWHIDASIIKLQDGTKCFIQAIIDNHSRYILACRATKNYGGIRTKELLRQALTKVQHSPSKPAIMPDKGSENLNDEVDILLREHQLERIIAQIDVDFSNSMVEALFRRMKHSYLFKQSLSSLEVLQEKLQYYINESNFVIPQSVLGGATPSEIFEGRFGKQDLVQLADAHKEAIKIRIATNQNANCGICIA
ncbi:MAG: DDE-type integrase/transposase/recombinase [Pseudobacteriovorax sp.]|nr:DDE-type integrase/transposase/recombinase [Pseudobacteriovorax sp.]